MIRNRSSSLRKYAIYSRFKNRVNPDSAQESSRDNGQDSGQNSQSNNDDQVNQNPDECVSTHDDGWVDAEPENSSNLIINGADVTSLLLMCANSLQKDDNIPANQDSDAGSGSDADADADAVSDSDDADSEHSSDAKKCRFCFDTDGEMISPCACTGSVAYVHEKCLLAELPQNVNGICTICHQKYNMDVFNDMYDYYFRYNVRTILAIISGFSVTTTVSMLLFNFTTPANIDGLFSLIIGILSIFGYTILNTINTVLTIMNIGLCGYDHLSLVKPSFLAHYAPFLELSIGETVSSAIRNVRSYLDQLVLMYTIINGISIVLLVRSDDNSTINNFMLRSFIVFWIVNIITYSLSRVFILLKRYNKIKFADFDRSNFGRSNFEMPSEIIVPVSTYHGNGNITTEYVRY